ncbi:ATP-dependent RecD-like DNA helicase [Pontibacter locisalis]|uniref:ATP-dependent RecD-like DNA helicase n=1 Tax=Pontibacter locisalis TaxID=1719035 RepID=A0ABW5IMH5_9BACT
MSIFTHFQHINLTTDQANALNEVDAFLKSEENVFILKGYAGSGKTTLLQGVVEYLEATQRGYALMAPTGRAAKVIKQKTLKEAVTIHKCIYSFKDLDEIKELDGEGAESFIYYFKLRNNTEINNKVYIIDEASMVSDVYSKGEFFRFGSGFLLTDLIEYSRVNLPNTNAKIIFVGDPAQLPPVGMSFSPALDEEYLNEKFSVSVRSVEIKEVKRQGGESGILKAAAKLRKCLTSGYFNDFDLRSNGRDIHNPSFADFLSTYNSIKGQKIIICYKNKTALDINQKIREDRFGARLSIQAGDHIIMGGNNYRLDLMNGEFGVVVKSTPTTESRNIPVNAKGGERKLVTLTWRWIEIMVSDDAGGERVVGGYMLENYLEGDNFLKPIEQQALYIDFKNRYPNLKPKSPEFKEAIKSDIYFNSLLLKYGYAVTCHKAQGGEWDAALTIWDRVAGESFNFKEQKHNLKGKTNSDFYRWAYTAITRASKDLYCINPPYFTSYSNLIFIPTTVQDAYESLTGKPVKNESFVLDADALTALTGFNLQEQPLSIQDHFVILRSLVRKKYMEITSYKRQGYEVWYTVGREADHATFKFWINGKNEFNGKFAQVPSLTNSAAFADEVQALLGSINQFNVSRNTASGILSKIEHDWELEESTPFLINLFDSLEESLGSKKIQVEDVEHLNYRERYRFSRGDEKAVVDFEYNQDGFFGRALPLSKQCNSKLLLENVESVLNQYSQKEHVI